MKTKKSKYFNFFKELLPDSKISFIIYFSFATIMFSWMFYAMSQYQDKITEWSKQENCVIKSSERSWFSFGPYSFWTCGKGTSIYKVETNKGEYWMRFTFFSLDIKEIKKQTDEKN